MQEVKRRARKYAFEITNWSWREKLRFLDWNSEKRNHWGPAKEKDKRAWVS